jgi:hypothetical protein
MRSTETPFMPSGEVIAPDTVRDPLLLAVDDVVFAVFGKLGFAG